MKVMVVRRVWGSVRRVVEGKMRLQNPENVEDVTFPSTRVARLILWVPNLGYGRGSGSDDPLLEVRSRAELSVVAGSWLLI